MQVWVIDFPVHIAAESVEAAREMLRPVSDTGPVTLTSEEGQVTVIYSNFPEDRGHDGQNPYDVDDHGNLIS